MEKIENIKSPWVETMIFCIAGWSYYLKQVVEKKAKKSGFLSTGALRGWDPYEKIWRFRWLYIALKQLEIEQKLVFIQKFFVGKRGRRNTEKNWNSLKLEITSFI